MQHRSTSPRLTPHSPGKRSRSAGQARDQKPGTAAVENVSADAGDGAAPRTKVHPLAPSRRVATLSRLAEGVRNAVSVAMGGTVQQSQLKRVTNTLRVTAKLVRQHSSAPHSGPSLSPSRVLGQCNALTPAYLAVQFVECAKQGHKVPEADLRSSGLFRALEKLLKAK